MAKVNPYAADVVVAGGTLSAGQQAGVGTTAVQLTSINCSKAIIQSDNANTINTLVGNSAGQTYVLTPGEEVTLEVTNLNQVYVKAASLTVTVNYLCT